MWLVEPSLRLLPVPVEVVRVEVLVRARGVLVLDVDVPVFEQRLGGEQVVRLIAPVVGVAERIEADGGRVDAEQEQPEGEGAPQTSSATSVW
ncbi:MAG: hypothetical protein ACRDLY_09575 [Thermoleophilaceae bacterium]